LSEFDHSKWAVSDKPSTVCIGDINRQVKIWFFGENYVLTSFLFFSLCLWNDLRCAIFCGVAEALGFNLRYKTFGKIRVRE
jgi:hypothetical protein